MNCSFCASAGTAIATAPKSAASAVPTRFPVIVLPFIGITHRHSGLGRSAVTYGPCGHFERRGGQTSEDRDPPHKPTPELPTNLRRSRTRVDLLGIKGLSHLAGPRNCARA